MVNINELQNKINILEEKIGPILDDFKKYYIFYNSAPHYDEYQSIYENLKGNLLSINNELLDISRNTNNKIVDINESFFKINKIIEDERNKNKKLKTIENGINDDYNGSEIMINEYKKKYNKSYTINVLMLLGIIISSITLIKVFTKNLIKGN
jgi:hypothetical protein